MRRHRHRALNLGARCYLGVVYLGLYLPIVILILFSFNRAQYSMLWHGFSWEWYRALFHSADLITAAWHSVLLGAAAASLAVSLGTIAAVSLYRYRFFGRSLLNLTFFILILLPDLVLGIALMAFYSLVKFKLGFWSLLIAHTTLCLPFVAVMLYSRLVTYDLSIFDAAIDLGANSQIIFTQIILPLLLPGIIAAWLLSFTLSLDDVMLSYFVSGPSFSILPLEIYSMIKLGVNPVINALATLIFVVTICFVTIAQFAMRKRTAS